jgi:predicted DNA-binding ribbon-helix-helix protein
MPPSTSTSSPCTRHIDAPYLRRVRTTVNLPDNLYVEARRLAAERKTSVTALLEDGLRAILAEARKPQPAIGSSLPFMDASGLRVDVDLTDTSALWEL